MQRADVLRRLRAERENLRERYGAAFAFRRAADEPFALRIEPQAGRFKDGDSQERLFLFAGKDHGGTGGKPLHLDHSKTDRQLLLGAISQFVGAPCRGRYAKFAQYAGREKGVGGPGVHERLSGPNFA